MHIVGIDLGTTHTVVARADARANAEPRIVHVAQLVTATETEAREVLPSCLYAPLSHERFDDPWSDAPWGVGEFARRRGAEVPARFVGSAKSWLGYGAVDRTAAILPWGAEDDGVPRISPLDASAKYLAHVRHACQGEIAFDSTSDALVVLTVPASFDEAARELTVEAARLAGLRRTCRSFASRGVLHRSQFFSNALPSAITCCLAATTWTSHSPMLRSRDCSRRRAAHRWARL